MHTQTENGRKTERDGHTPIQIYAKMVVYTQLNNQNYNIQIGLSHHLSVWR